MSPTPTFPSSMASGSPSWATATRVDRGPSTSETPDWTSSSVSGPTRRVTRPRPTVSSPPASKGPTMPTSSVCSSPMTSFPACLWPPGPTPWSSWPVGTRWPSGDWIRPATPGWWPPGCSGPRSVAVISKGSDSSPPSVSRATPPERPGPGSWPWPRPSAVCGKGPSSSHPSKRPSSTWPSSRPWPRRCVGSANPSSRS